MVGLSRLLVLSLALMLGGCSLGPGLYIPDSNLEYQDTTGSGWQMRNNALVYGAKAPEPVYKVTTIDASVIATQERDRLQAPRALNEAAPADEARQYEYTVGAEDVLAFTVWDHPELTSPTAAANAAFTAAVSPLGVSAPQAVPSDSIGHVVDKGGTIFFPYVGEIKVEGLTLNEIRKKIAAALSAFVPNPQVGVRVLAYRSKKTYITGEVKIPGTVYISDIPLRVTDAISAVQGATVEADLHRVRLTRGNESFVINLLALYDDGDISQNWLLRDGDILNVPTIKDSKVFVMGEVQKPDVLFIRKGRMTLAESIGLSGGLNQASANAKRVFVIRGLDEQPQAPAVYHLDLSRPDALLLSTRFDLKPLDVVYVSTADVTRWSRVISQIIPTVQQLSTSGYYFTR